MVTLFFSSDKILTSVNEIPSLQIKSLYPIIDVSSAVDNLKLVQERMSIQNTGLLYLNIRSLPFINQKYTFSQEALDYFQNNDEHKQKIILYVEKIIELMDIDIEIDIFHDLDFGITEVISIPPNPKINKIDYEDKITDIIIENFPSEDFLKLIIDVRRN